ncbi:MAG: NAD-glutamate dehydrogenase, partial [Pseudomonadota bacterium]
MLIANSGTFEAKIDEVRTMASERLPAAEAAEFTEALALFFAHAAHEEVAENTAEELYGASLSLWKFCRQRAPGKAKVRVYNPQMAEAGWESGHTLVEIVNDDMPFLVDSITVLMNDRGLGIHALIHPMMRLKRDAAGARTGFAAAEDPEAVRESVIQVQVDQIGQEAELEALRVAIEAMLGDVRAAVTDWKAMLGRLTDVTEHLRTKAPAALGAATAEGCAFLEWLGENHFTFLGYRTFRFGAGGTGFEPVAETGLGVLRDPHYTVMRDSEGNFAHWTPELTDFTGDDQPVLIIKANRRATVHRGSHYDVVAVREYADTGEVMGEQVFVGLFTSSAYNRSPHSIPLLREKLDRVIRRAGFQPASHDGKALDNVLETYPRDELFQCTDQQLFENAMGVLHLATRPRTRLFLRPDRFGRFVSCITYVPRERYNTELRVQLGNILCAALDGRVASWEPSFDMEALARVHFVIALPGGNIPDYNADEIEYEVIQATRNWSDRLMDELVERHGEHLGHGLHKRFGRGFGASYRELVPVAAAVSDIAKIEPLSAQAPLSVHFYRKLEDDAAEARFKIYHHGGSVPLSDCLPVLENMGFRVLDEHPYKLDCDQDEIWIHDFYMRTAAGAPIDLAKLRRKLDETFCAAWDGVVDDDPLNRLCVLAGLGHRDIAILRAYSRFLRQARIPYSLDYMEDALAEYPDLARLLVRVFLARFDPRTGLGREAREAEAERIAKEIEAELEAVPSLDVDRILRRFLNAIQSTLRTNAFQPEENGAPKAYLSFKFDCAALDALPLPRPWREIFVYATWVEGVHLRQGPVARGGLRWSDRKEDYRTEILGLVKAQQVKNAVIVPVGSKGGFLPKKLPAGGTREAVQAEAIRCYRTFLSGLLDITDNLAGATVVPPENVVRFDEDDPYLVVAADKGTATFSDIANGIAADYGFWLDDAFASGGSNGYDHKGMGITARGGWEAVKRHFRELGHDTQTQPFTVIGCGDMSGDVFGNGMLLSDQIRLQAAFDHRDIFIDPDPDPARSFAERKRLFELPRTTWKDYETGLISTGGGVFPRSAKSIPLSPEIQALTGLTAEQVTPNELIKALLSTPCDLVWFGGIGTYIKAESESHADAGDRANDVLRVDAGEVQARVIGEGANLGVTQLGRIALSAKGVKVNTDAVDNSAGVDCSDHEVNIKIALGAVQAEGDITEKQRNALLAEMTDTVADLVLATNYSQTGAISMVEARAPRLLSEHARFMRALEGRGLLDRAVELLPDDEALAERAAEGRGLTRPELSVLVAYAKITLFDAIVASRLPDEPYAEAFLLDYMPAALVERHREAVLAHRLRREIVSTVVANLVVNAVGPSFVLQAGEETGAGAGEIAESLVAARQIFGIGALRAEVNALDNRVAASVQTEMHLALSDCMVSQSACILHRPGGGGMGALIESYKPGVDAILDAVGAMLSDFSARRLEERAGKLMEAGVPEGLALRVSSLEFLGGALDIVDVAAEQGRAVQTVAETYFAAGARFGLDWLRANARGLETADHWERIALGRLIADLRAQQSRIAAAALEAGGETAGAACVAT